MTRTTNNVNETRKRKRRAGIIIMGCLSTLLILFALPALSVGMATATNSSNISTVAPYYANESSSVNNGTWYAGIGNATLDSLGRMATRLGPYFVGTGEMDRSGTGFEGVLLTAIIMTAMFVGAVAMLPVGSVGGAVLAVIVGYGMTEVGLAPSWVRILLVFAVGIIAFVAFLQAQQGR